MAFIQEWTPAFLVLFNIFSTFIMGDVILQSKQSCGSNMAPREERIKSLNEFYVYSHVGDFYAPYKDCVVVIIGEEFHQWSIELTNLDVDDHRSRCKIQPCCKDYLKLFNAYTIDNARLFPTIPWRGLCGNDLPRRRTFTSTQNYVTIQFNSDLLADKRRGFILKMRQYPRRSAGNDFYESGFHGVWNDGSLNELQIDWSEQETIPGDFSPGQNPTFEFDPNGVQCYNCLNCKKDYFRTSAVGVSVEKGCYVCTKEWLQGTGQASRQCLSRKMYQEKLQTLRDPSNGNPSITDFRSCKTFARGVVGTNYINLCVCDTDNCNAGTGLTPDWRRVAIVVIVIFCIVRFVWKC